MSDEINAAVERSLTVAGKGRNHGRLGEETAKRYAKSWADAHDWLVSQGLSTVTAWSSETLAQYAGVLLEQGYAVSSVDGRLAAVKAEHRRRGWVVPDGVPAWYVLRGRNSNADDGVKVNTSGLRRAALASALQHLDPGTTVRGARDLCLATLGWDLMARPCDLVNVDVEHVREVDDDQGGEPYLEVRVRGRWLPVEHLHEPVDVCPVEATQMWLSTLEDHAVREGPLFRPVDKGGNVAGSGDPYAGHETAGRLKPDGLGYIWSRIMAAGRYPSSKPRDMRFASSLEAARAGVPVLWILDRAGWSLQGRALERLYAAAREGQEARDGR
jgi:hypothetical protein